MKHGEALNIWTRNGLKLPELPLDECIFPNAERFLNIEQINAELLEEHKQWAKILGHIIVTFLQGNYEALVVYSKMGIEYKDGEPWLKSKAIAKTEGK